MSDLSCDCAAIVEQMGDYLDRELSVEEVEVVKAHLEACPECENAFRWEDSVLRLVKSVCSKTRVLPEGLEEEILQSLDLADSE